MNLLLVLVLLSSSIIVPEPPANPMLEPLPPMVIAEPIDPRIWASITRHPGFVPSSTGDCDTTGIHNWTIEGFGATTDGSTPTTGGCKAGQTILVVDTLNDVVDTGCTTASCLAGSKGADGKISLREAINMTGPRLVKFGISGLIQPVDQGGGEASFSISGQLGRDDLTIDGQDAPNGGIVIGNPARSDISTTFSISAGNIIIRYIRIMQGQPRHGQGAAQVIQDNGFTGHGVVFDHVSIYWGMDGTLDTGVASKYTTVQWSILAEMSQSGHTLIKYNASDATTFHTFHHNLWASGVADRSGGEYVGDLDMVNNVFYNNFSDGPSGRAWCEGMTGVIGSGTNYGALTGNSGDNNTNAVPQRINYVKNTWKCGSNNVNAGTNFIYTHFFNNVDHTPATSAIWLDSNETRKFDNTVGYFTNLVGHQGPDGNFPIAGARFSFPSVTTTSASQAFTDVIAGAGATLPCRDDADTRVTNYVSSNASGQGSFVSNSFDQTHVPGTWPDLTQPCSGTPSPLRGIGGKVVLSGKTVMH